MTAAQPKRILALDLGTHCGWAIRSLDGMRDSGVSHFAADRHQGAGMRFLHFKRWLTDVKGVGLDLIVYEAVQSHGKAGTHTAQLYGGFVAMLQAWAEHHGIPYEGVNVSTLKKHATGKGNAGKPLMIDRARELGANPEDDNEADAVCLLDYAERVLTIGVE